jgi:hypothetical protein
MCWSRAYLGFVEVVDFRQGSDIRVVAAEMVSDGIKVARVPITEYEYYLIENRNVDIDGLEAFVRADSARSVILGPITEDKEFNREYDILAPGSGMLIFHVDERVASLDYNYDGYDNFHDNHLQWAFDIYGNEVDRFIKLVEADGIVNFAGLYRAGYGSEDDMFRDDRNDAFTPNSNPPTIDNSGNNTHVYITDIRRDSVAVGSDFVKVDSVVFFDLETDRLVEGFPMRAGFPMAHRSPITDDLDGDGNPEIIVASDNRLLVMTPDGQNFLRQYTGCATCPIYEDTAFATVNYGVPHPLPMYAQTPEVISAGPVTGAFADDPTNMLVAVGYPLGEGDSGMVALYNSLRDEDEDGLADLEYGIDSSFFETQGVPVHMSFGDILYVVTDDGVVYEKASQTGLAVRHVATREPSVAGLARAGSEGPIALSYGESSWLTFFSDVSPQELELPGAYTLGPVAGDLDIDGDWEVVVGSTDGKVLIVSFDPDGMLEVFSIAAERDFDFEFTVPPVIGDVDLDGQPDIIIGGRNAIYAFNHELTLKTSFPVEINDRFPGDPVFSPPIGVVVWFSAFSR